MYSSIAENRKTKAGLCRLLGSWLVLALKNTIIGSGKQEDALLHAFV